MSHDEAEADVMTGQITVGEVLVWLIITSAYHHIYSLRPSAYDRGYDQGGMSLRH
jgi:hypothetical protein